MKRSPEILGAAYADSSLVIAYHGLHDGQPQAGAVLLGRVVGSEQASAFFLGQSAPGIGKLKYGELVIEVGTKDQPPAFGHSVNGIEHQVLDHAAQQRRICVDPRDVAQLHLRLDAGGALLELSLKELDHATDHFI